VEEWSYVGIASQSQELSPDVNLDDKVKHAMLAFQDVSGLSQIAEFSGQSRQFSYEFITARH
jgi:hypothetical protein